MPIEQLLAMYGYDGNRGASTSRLPTGFGDQILGSEDLTLDKDEIARDLLQHTDHDRETSVNDLLDSVDITASSQTVRLLRCKFMCTTCLNFLLVRQSIIRML